VRASSVIEQHHGRRQHAKMLRHLGPSKLPDPSCRLLSKQKSFLVERNRHLLLEIR
jgi:hypothetical protein